MQSSGRLSFLHVNAYYGGMYILTGLSKAAKNIRNWLVALSILRLSAKITKDQSN